MHFCTELSIQNSYQNHTLDIFSYSIILPFFISIFQKAVIVSLILCYNWLCQNVFWKCQDFQGPRTLLGLLANGTFLLASIFFFFVTLKEGIDSGGALSSCWVGPGFRFSQPSEEGGRGEGVVIPSLVMVVIFYSHGAKWERQNSSLTAQTAQIRVTMRNKQKKMLVMYVKLSRATRSFLCYWLVLQIGEWHEHTFFSLEVAFALNTAPQSKKETLVQKTFSFFSPKMCAVGQRSVCYEVTFFLRLGRDSQNEHQHHFTVWGTAHAEVMSNLPEAEKISQS